MDSANGFGEQLEQQHGTFTEACLKLNAAIVSLHASHEANVAGLADQRAELQRAAGPLQKQLQQLEVDGRGWQEQCRQDCAAAADKVRVDTFSNMDDLAPHLPCSNRVTRG